MPTASHHRPTAPEPDRESPGARTLERRWADLGGAAASPDWAAAGARLIAHYDQPWRGYHNRRHIEEALDAVQLLGGGLAEQVAIWFHDAVYGLGAGADERASADLADAELRSLGLARSMVAQVVRLVLVTEHHSPTPGDIPGAQVSDADMAILAAAPERYDESVAGIRREYRQFDDAQFTAGRIAVLEGFLQRPALFHTPHGRRHWERPARANIARELAARRSGC